VRNKEADLSVIQNVFSAGRPSTSNIAQQSPAHTPSMQHCFSIWPSIYCRYQI